MQALSQDEQAARAVGLSLLRAHQWPFRSSTDGVADFLAVNARLVKASRNPFMVLWRCNRRWRYRGCAGCIPILGEAENSTCRLCNCWFPCVAVSETFGFSSA